MNNLGFKGFFGTFFLSKNGLFSVVFWPIFRQQKRPQSVGSKRVHS